MKLADRQACTGCSACFAVCQSGALSMVEDAEGFLRPLIDVAKCVGCGLCRKACPLLTGKQHKVEPECFAARTRDEKLLISSSSGGIFGELTQWALSENGVVFGCVMELPRSVAHHVMGDTAGKVAAMRGAKYVQSDVRNTFKECRDSLSAGKKVLFTGTPCQIAGLLSFLGRESESLLTMEIICHGVSSPSVFDKYLREICGDNRIRNVLFRKKGGGFTWKHPGFAIGISGRTKTAPLHGNPYFSAFSNELAARPSCSECRFKSGTSGADFTVGDFWGIRHVREIDDDDKGMSVVFLNTPKAKLVFRKLKGRLESHPLSYRQAVEGNPSYAKSFPPHSKRDYFMSNFGKKRIDELVWECLGVGVVKRFIRRVKTWGGRA